MGKIDPTKMLLEAAHAFMLEEADFADDDSEARRHLAAGRPIFYVEPETPAGMVIRESPDGSRDYVQLDGHGGYKVVRPA